ncbi:AAA family ATPase [Gemmatimonadota bacterium]
MPAHQDQNYLDYWGFDRAPFALTPDPDMLYLSKQHRECMLRMQYAIAGNKGGALMVSENPGDGKTSVLRKLEKDLIASTDDNYRIVFIDHPTLTPNQMLWEILRQLGFGESRGEKIQNLLQLREALVEMFERGERCVFILDEGQLLADRPELLQEFRVLLNYTIGDTFLLTFIFSGQSELEGTMKRLPEFYQRLPVRYFLHSMDLVDTGRMLEHRIRIAGYTGSRLFTDAAVKEIYRYSRGIPRVICSVADLTLVVGHSRSVRQINDREVFMAIRDMDRSTQDGYHYYHFLRSAGVATPEEQKEIAAAEAELDRKEAEAALDRLEATEQGGAKPIESLAAEIEAWSPGEDARMPEQEEPAAEHELEPEMDEGDLAREPEDAPEMALTGSEPEPEPEMDEGDLAREPEDAPEMALTGSEPEPEPEPEMDEGDLAREPEDAPEMALPGSEPEPEPEMDAGDLAREPEDAPEMALPGDEEELPGKPEAEEEDEEIEREESAGALPLISDFTYRFYGDETDEDVAILAEVIREFEEPETVEAGETAFETPDEETEEYYPPVRDLSGGEPFVHCPSCGTRQQAERGTCVQCSGPLHWICPSCQFKNSAHRARCDRCGQSLAQALHDAEHLLRESVNSSISGPQWGFVSTPEFSLKLAEGERILTVVKDKSLLGKGVSIRARTQAWGSREQRVDIVITNHRLHIVAKELQSRVPYHEIQGVRAGKGKVHLFFKDGGLRIGYPASENAIYSLTRNLIEFLEFQTSRYRV